MTKTKETKKETLAQIAPEAIAPNPNNPRTILKTTPAMQELIDSVRASGVKQPVMVREYRPTKLANHKCRYQLLAGSRRLLAATEAGCKSIPAIVHEGLTPEEEFEITFTENFAREDLTPLEQGFAVALLLERYKGDTKAVAAKLGKERRYVGALVAIHANLSKPWRTVIEKDVRFSDWTAAHIEQIARLPAVTQAKWLEEFKSNPWFAGRGAEETAKMIQEEQRLLCSAPWKLDDETLIPKAGACSECPKCTAFVPDLFADDDETPEVIQKNNRCLDSVCWNRKAGAVGSRKIKKLREEHGTVLAASTHHYLARKKAGSRKNSAAWFAWTIFGRPRKTTKARCRP